MNHSAQTAVCHVIAVVAAVAVVIWECVVSQAGVDVLAGDRLGKLKLSREGVQQRNKVVFNTAAALQAPVTVCMGGGYGKNLRDTVQSHADVYLQAIERALQLPEDCLVQLNTAELVQNLVPPGST